MEWHVLRLLPRGAFLHPLYFEGDTQTKHDDAFHLDRSYTYRYCYRYGKHV
jgi:hypothetical protein